MDQPDDFEFEYDIDEAVRQFVDQYPCEDNAHRMENDRVDRRFKSTGQSRFKSILPCEAGSSESATTEAEDTERLSWAVETLPIHPIQTPPINQCMPSSQATAHPHLDPSTNFQFLSGAVVLEDRSRASKQKRSLDEESVFKCEHPGCNYRGSFSRKYELQRHLLKHTARTKYQCPIQHCAKPFYRTDKLRLHLRQSHKEDDEASCPLPACGVNGLPWILVRLHLRNHDPYQPIGESHNGAFALIKEIRKLDGRQRSCPVQSCQRHDIEPWLMREHLQSHTFRERDENKRHILEAGYDAISTKISCPICQTLWTRHRDFKNHVENIHIVKDWAHLHKLRGISYSSWTFEGVMKWFHDDSSCCSDMKTDPAHHLKYLQDPEELRPYRVTLLKLWPELGSHPIFDDIMPKGEPSEWRKM